MVIATHQVQETGLSHLKQPRRLRERPRQIDVNDSQRLRREHRRRKTKVNGMLKVVRASNTKTIKYMSCLTNKEA